MRKVYVGGAFTSMAAIIATWVALGLSGGSGETACPLPAYPDATCAGIPTGTTLTPAGSPNLQVTTPGQTLDAVDVAGCIDVRVPGVTIKNSRAQCITTSQDASASDPANTPLTVQDSEVDCKWKQGGVGGATGIYYRNIRVYRTDIHGCENALDMFKDFVLQDSYVHDLTHCEEPNCTELDPPHSDGIQSADGTNTTIEHNTIYAFTPPCTYPNDGTCNGTAAININNDSGGPVSTNVLIKDNLVAGGANAIYCPIVAAVDFRMLHNHFSTVYSPVVGEFAPSTACADETLLGNVYHETGLPVELN